MNFKKRQMNLFTKLKTDPQTQKTNLQLTREKWGVEINQEFGINIYTLLYIKQITNENMRTYCTVQGTLLKIL